MPAWLLFVLSAGAIVAAGVRLSRDGDTIAERTGLGGAWVGTILVAGATSLPELLTDFFAVRQGSPNLALGDLFGSSMTNMLILAVADLLTREVRVLMRVAVNQALVGALAICLTALAAAGVLVGSDLTLLGVGWATLALGLGYTGGMRLLHQNRAGPPFMSRAEAAEAARRPADLGRAVTGFGVAALVILIAAPALAGSAADLAGQLGISTSLLGVTLLALTTSLPEAVVSYESVRRGAYDLAVGNLLGSNCFNMVLLLVLDIADGPSALLSSAEPGVLIAALFAILLMGQVLLDVLNTAGKRRWYLEPSPMFLVLTYAAGLILSARMG